MKIYNFSAGPACLPEEVMREAREEFIDYRSKGLSVMEMSHRSDDYKEIIDSCRADVKKLAGIGDDYDVLFLQGGASLQFAMLPINLLKKGRAGYILTGNWAKKAYEEACKYGDIEVLASSGDDDYSYIPDLSNIVLPGDLDYVHITENNTIYGTQYKEIPDFGNTTLVNDASSCIFSRKMDFNKFGLVYAGAQKNLGPAGATLVIVRKDLLNDDLPSFTPSLLDYKKMADKESMYNTPPTYTIYMIGKVVRWIINQGGLEEIEARNEKKAALLYDYLDKSKIFTGHARKDSRSLMNVTFRTESPDLDKEFLDLAKAQGLINLKGHRSIGGLRASIYNYMPIEGVNKLIELMETFERKKI